MRLGNKKSASVDAVRTVNRRLRWLISNEHRPGLAFYVLAKAVARRTRMGKSCPSWLATAMLAVAPSTAHRELARDLRRALISGDADPARSIAGTAAYSPDLRAEKIVSHRFGFVWLCNPKVASRSLIAALCAADRSAQLIEHMTIAELHSSQQRTRDYFSFAFVRNPYTRAHSFYADKVLRASNSKKISRIAHHHGVAEDSSFDEVCAWLNTPYGSDALADRHWLSQHRQIRLPTGELPDFVGRYERLEDDLAYVVTLIGMPQPELPIINTSVGWKPDLRLAEQARYRRAKDLTERNRALLRTRYAADFELFGYSA